MTAQHFDLSPLLPALHANSLILTPNNRLRRKILQAWGETCVERGEHHWPTPKVYSLLDWQAECWQELQDMACPGCDRTIASEALRRYAWQKAIQQASEGAELYKTEVLAASADAAWRNLALWQIQTEQLDPFMEPDFDRYLGWLKFTQKQLDDRQLITNEAATELVIKGFREGFLDRQKSILLHGFDDFPPLHRALCQAASEEVVESSNDDLPEGHVYRTTAHNEEQEILAAARWGQYILEQNPQARIGIIVPNLGQSRDEVERVFTEVFEAHSLLPDQARYTLPFNFSAGTPLGSTPLVSDTLKLLNLSLKRWPLDDICDTLLSPFWHAGNDHFRANVCDRLRRLGQLSISGTDVREACLKLEDPAELGKRLQALNDLQRGRPRYQSAAEWAEQFQQQLELCQWPGDRRLDSNEYQQAGQWFQLLEQFAELNGIGASLSINEALKTLSQLANNVHFQAQTPDSPIQILGVLEGAGLKFSHCWVMGLNRKVWPPAPAPNALLPIALQRHFQMPHASVERELQFAESLTHTYRQSAPEVIFSSAAQDEESALHPSALIADIPLSPLSTILPDSPVALERYCHEMNANTQLEVVECWHAPMLEEDEKQKLRGGSGILQQQADCPFNAFAIYRLAARNVEPPSPGLSALERGVILHSVLQLFWEDVKTSDTLNALDEVVLQKKISECIHLSLRVWRKRRAHQCGPRYFDLEQQRLQKLVSTWLEVEKSRPPFALAACEESIDLNLAGLPLTLRLDRLDTLEDGSVLLIDYKTGEPAIKSWSSDKPKEPQLPLYVLSLDTPCAGIAFAQLNTKACQFLGLGELAAPIQGIQAPSDVRNSDLPPSWEALVPHWQTVLGDLSIAFQKGDARVAFKDRYAGQYSTALLGLNRFPERSTVEKFRKQQAVDTIELNSNTPPVQRDWLDD